MEDFQHILAIAKISPLLTPTPTAKKNCFSGYISIKLDIPGEKEFENNGVSYCTVCDGSLFRRKDVAIIGRGTGLGKGSVYMIPIARHIETINTDPILKTEKTYIQRIEQAKNINVVNAIV